MARVGYRGGQRRWLLIVVIAVVVLAIVFTILSGFYIDLLWYREVHLASVFWTVWRSKILLGLTFGLLFFAMLYSSLLLARRISPTTRILTPDLEAVERIRQGIDPYLWWLLPAGCLVLALITGVGVSHEWQTFLLWRNSSGVTFGHPEPLFNRDPAFYVFSLPWWKFLQGWLFSTLVTVTFLTAIAHVLWGGIRPQAPAISDKITPPVRAHLSVLLALILLVKAWGYWLGRFDLLTSPRGVVEGATYTDVKAQLPALNFLVIVAVICAVLFLVNIRVRQWLLPVIAVALLGLVSVLLGAAYPAYVQTFSVKPQELQRETPYIQDNINGTRQAFNLGTDHVSVVNQTNVDLNVTPADVQANDPTVSNIRLWRPEVLAENFQSLQRLRQYYDFRDVDVDRYPLSGQERVLMVSGREVSQAQIPGQQTWQNRHLVYTHGFGAVAAQVNAATPEGTPEFTLRGIPPEGEPLPSQPRIYYGEQNDVAFVVVHTGTQELDFEGAPNPEQYHGLGGIPMGNMLQRALFAWRYRDINLLISSLISSNSRIMINRSIQDRVPKPAPFLTFDGDPYLAIVDGRLKWIWDAYTTTSAYPYSQSVDLNEATDGILGGSVNYMRNSVKVVVDAYDGTMTYYADESDPILKVWANAFPDLFTPMTAASEQLRQHFRYPENLFQVQAWQFGRYHVTDPQVFFQNQDLWQVPNDPTLSTTSAAATIQPAQGRLLRPFYQLMKLPGQAVEQFQLTIPFVPQGRPNMVAFMSADSDGCCTTSASGGAQTGGYGQVTAFTFPSGRNVLGPSQVFSAINQDPAFSSQRTLLGTGGSTIIFGDLLVIPIENSFLYVQPVYVRSQQENAIPQLKRVVVVDGETVGTGSDLQAALNQAVGTQGPANQPPPTGTTDQQINSLLNQALQHFQAADAALKLGDLGTYQSELAKAQSLVQQANSLAAQSAKQGGTTPVSLSASPSAGAGS